MTLRSVLVMFVLAVLVFGAWIALKGETGGGDTMPSSLPPTFDPRDVGEIFLEYQGEEKTLRRRTGESDVWEVASGTTYVRAKSLTVDDMLRSLSRIRDDLKSSIRAAVRDAESGETHRSKGPAW